MRKLVTALVAAVFAAFTLSAIPAYAQAPKSDGKDRSVRKDGRQAKAKAKAKRATKKAERKARGDKKKGKR